MSNTAKIMRLSSAIYNDIVAGLQGYEASLNMSLEQLQDEVVMTRLEVIKKYAMKNQIPKKDLYQAITCIPVDCKSLDKCCACDGDDEYMMHLPHFEIPQLVNDFGEDAIAYIGASNKHTPFKVYTSLNFLSHKYKMRSTRKPYVYIDTTPNERNFYDVYIFGAPMLERVSVIGIFKDERQLDEFACCCNQCGEPETEVQDTTGQTPEITENITWLDQEVKETIIKRKIQYYRQLYPQPYPNDQVPR